MMDPAVVDQFLKTITQAGNQPAFIHCASGNRAAGMWFVKRVLVDKWDLDKAGAEADDDAGVLQGRRCCRAAGHDAAQKRRFTFSADPVSGNLQQVGLRKRSCALRARKKCWWKGLLTHW